MNEPKMIGFGHYVPKRIVTNSELEQSIDTNDKWIKDNLGISERRIVGDELTSDLAYFAGLNAILNSGIDKHKIDLIILATATPDRLAPSTASKVQARLGLQSAAFFDINAVCSGSIYAITIAAGMIKSSLFRNVLVIGADTFSKITNWERRDAVFFGDGAGAVVMTAQNHKHFLSMNISGDGSGWQNFTIPGGASEHPLSQVSLEAGLRHFQMNGRAVYETATKVLPETIAKSLIDANLSSSDIHHVIPHQPSIRILKRTSEITGIPWNKWHTNMEYYANTSSATVLLMLSEAHQNGNFRTDENILFAAVGSGWTFGSLIYNW